MHLDELQTEVEQKRAEVSERWETASDLRKKYALVDSDPETIEGKISTERDTNDATVKEQMAEYSAAKSRYTGSRILMSALQQRYDGESFNHRDTAANFIGSAFPELEVKPTHTLPGATESQWYTILFLLLSGLACGLAVALALLLGVRSPEAPSNAA